jgi:hypothetical protein
MCRSGSGLMNTLFPCVVLLLGRPGMTNTLFPCVVLVAANPE